MAFQSGRARCRVPPEWAPEQLRTTFIQSSQLPGRKPSRHSKGYEGSAFRKMATLPILPVPADRPGLPAGADRHGPDLPALSGLSCLTGLTDSFAQGVQEEQCILTGRSDCSRLRGQRHNFPGNIHHASLAPNMPQCLPA